jgi:hypothetical protein
MKNMWPDGVNVVESEEGFWDGAAFVQNWGAAKQFRPCSDDYVASLVEAEKLTGKACWLFYVAICA